jgi:hypothetical protein
MSNEGASGGRDGVAAAAILDSVQAPLLSSHESKGKDVDREEEASISTGEKSTEVLVLQVLRELRDLRRSQTETLHVLQEMVKRKAEDGGLDIAAAAKIPKLKGSEVGDEEYAQIRAGLNQWQPTRTRLSQLRATLCGLIAVSDLNWPCFIWGKDYLHQAALLREEPGPFVVTYRSTSSPKDAGVRRSLADHIAREWPATVYHELQDWRCVEATGWRRSIDNVQFCGHFLNMEGYPLLFDISDLSETFRPDTRGSQDCFGIVW